MIKKYHLKSLIVNLKSSLGFTLIELVVTIGILAILAVFVLAALNPLVQFQKARDGQRKSDLAQLQRALEQYYQDHGSYPASNAMHQITDPNGGAIPWGGSAGWSPYMNLIPSDPDSTRTYVYVTSGVSPQTYNLYASIELGPNDPQTCNATVANCMQNPQSVQYCTCPNVPNGVNCGVNSKQYPCNFGVSSPNTTP